MWCQYTSLCGKMENHNYACTDMYKCTHKGGRGHVSSWCTFKTQNWATLLRRPKLWNSIFSSLKRVNLHQSMKYQWPNRRPTKNTAKAKESSCKQPHHWSLKPTGVQYSKKKEIYSALVNGKASRVSLAASRRSIISSFIYFGDGDTY